MFARGSRYERVAEAVYITIASLQIPYKRLRIIPDTIALQTYTVAQLDRLDRIAFRFYQDPEQFWRICDANHALLPEELTSEAGRRLVIPLAER
jgi:hypothetical protein